MSEPVLVLDASALLAVLLDEQGADSVSPLLRDAVISTVNLSEVVARLQDRGAGDDVIAASIDELGLQVVPFASDHALRAGLLRGPTRNAGLSLGDRACLALAQALGGVAVTCDRAWAGLALDVPVRLVR